MVIEEIASTTESLKHVRRLGEIVECHESKETKIEETNEGSSKHKTYSKTKEKDIVRLLQFTEIMRLLIDTAVVAVLMVGDGLVRKISSS